MGIPLETAIKTQRMIFEKCAAVVEKKGADYNRKQQKDGDTLFNMRISSFKKIVRSPQAGVLVRLDDKMQRLASLENPSEDPANGDEKILDTVCDAINYLTYFYMFYNEELNEMKAVGALINAEVQRQDSKQA
jgi:hypothetical protein